MRGRSKKNKEPDAITNQFDIGKELPVKKARAPINVEEIATFCNKFSEI